MSERHWVRGFLEEAMALARSSQTVAAIARLEEGLRKARELQDSGAVSSLAKHAGLQSYHLGDYQEAVRYYEEALRSKPTDGWLHLALAEAHTALGREESVKLALAAALELANRSGDIELARIVRQKAGSYDGTAE